MIFPSYQSQTPVISASDKVPERRRLPASLQWALTVLILLSVFAGYSHSSGGSKKARAEVSSALSKATSGKESDEDIASSEIKQVAELRAALHSLQVGYAPKEEQEKEEKQSLQVMGHSLIPCYAGYASELDPACSICSNEFEKREICQLSCRHSFCRQCIDKISTFSASDMVCPNCRQKIMRKDLVRFTNPEDFYQKLPMKCQKKGCLWNGSLAELVCLAEDARCPFPLQVLLGIPHAGFPGQRADAMLGWLQKKFEAKGYVVSSVSYRLRRLKRKTCYQEESGEPEMMRDLVISIENGSAGLYRLYYPLPKTLPHTSEEQFLQENLLNIVLDISLDMLFFDLKRICPEAFDQESDIFIKSYSRKDDTLIISRKSEHVALTLSIMCDPIKQKFDFDILKTAMALQGMEYYKLSQSGKLPAGELHFDDIHEIFMSIRSPGLQI